MTRRVDLDVLREIANEHSEEILSDLGIAVDTYGDAKCACPVHGGDNPRAFSWDNKRGTWNCFTKQCHKSSSTTILSLIKAVKNCSWAEVVEFVENISGQKVESIDLNVLEQKRFIKKQSKKYKKYNAVVAKLDEKILQNVQTPSKWFIEEKGMDEAIMTSCGSFDCNVKGKSFYNRACVPVYNENSELIAVAGRTKGNSDIKWLVYPPKNTIKKTFYGIHLAQDIIKKSGKVILVEGFLDCLRMWSYGYLNCVSIFGTDLTQDQIKLLVKLKVKEITVCLDPDAAGMKATNTIMQDPQTNLLFKIKELTSRVQNQPQKMTQKEAFEFFGEPVE